MADRPDDDSDGSIDEQDVATTTKLLLRINAANLSRHGILQALPDTYAVVTSVVGRASRSGPEGGAVNDGMSMVEWGRTEM